MSTLTSEYTPLCEVSLPYKGRQFYMHEFDLAAPSVPEGFEDYLKPVVDLCTAAKAFVGKAFLTVDEKVVQPGMSQRRPGPHVDGCFIKAKNYWGHGQGGWNHTCNNVPIPRMPIIVAASVAGCKVWRGEFSASPKSDGDLSHIQSELGDGEVLPANIGYLFSPDCIHESMRFTDATKRTFMRIALPVGART